MSLEIHSNPASPVDTEEDIAEMMAEAAQVDAMFQRGAISTMWLIGSPELPALAARRARADAKPIGQARLVLCPHSS